jgi:hypothetical protein
MICDGAPLVVIVPADLVAARIRRKNPSLSKETARQMAAELDDITACAIACARKQLWAEPGFSPAHENELIEVMTYVIIEGDESADGDHEYLVGMLYHPDTEGSGDDLYLRYMRLFDRINGTNMVGDFDLDGPPMKKPELCIVRNDLPPFDTLKQAVIAAVLLARKGEGSGSEKDPRSRGGVQGRHWPQIHHECDGGASRRAVRPSAERRNSSEKWRLDVIDIIAARIRRANPSIGKEAARQMAAELDDIIACALKRWRAAPHFGVVEVDEVDVAFDDADGNDLIQTMTYAIIDDKDLSASELDHLDYMLSVLESVSDDSRDLYLRYMRLSERINGTDLVGRFKLDPRAKKSRLVLVRNDIPSLDAIMQALIPAVRLAQSGKGPTKILDLLPAFKDSSGLDFVMQATEEHRKALLDLLQDAGIPVV